LPFDGVGVVAFTPQFLHLTSTLNNDNLLHLLTAATVSLLRQRRMATQRGAHSLCRSVPRSSPKSTRRSYLPDG
jgi:hypothetical protein